MLQSLFEPYWCDLFHSRNAKTVVEAVMQGALTPTSGQLGPNKFDSYTKTTEPTDEERNPPEPVGEYPSEGGTSGGDDDTTGSGGGDGTAEAEKPATGTFDEAEEKKLFPAKINVDGQGRFVINEFFPL